MSLNTRESQLLVCRNICHTILREGESARSLLKESSLVLKIHVAAVLASVIGPGKLDGQPHVGGAHVRVPHVGSDRVFRAGQRIA